MIIDCFLFFDELDLLEIRLNELKDVVDVFVLTESPYTFTGTKKPLYFQENKDRFRDFNVIPAIYNPLTTVYRPEDYEARQKQYNLDYAYSVIGGDIIIQGDCDEIPRADVIKKAAREDWQSALLVMDLFYYWLNCKRVGAKKKFKNSRLYRPEGPITYNAKQNGKVDKTYWEAGWHFSYLGDIQAKLKAWGHANQYDKPPYNTPEHIERCKEEGADILNRGMKFKFMEDLSYLPQYVLDNLGKFEKYIHNILH
jgi:hypothetical protein